MEITKLQELCKDMVKVRVALTKLKEEKTELESDFKRMKAEAVAHLDEHDLKGFDHGEGKISISTKRSVKMLDKYKFFEWLKDRGDFEEVVSINAQSLTKIYNIEYDAAEEAGDALFIVNGLTEHGVSQPNVFRDIKFLK